VWADKVLGCTSFAIGYLPPKFRIPRSDLHNLIWAARFANLALATIYNLIWAARFANLALATIYNPLIQMGYCQYLLKLTSSILEL
jgi:hypothetical protein